MSVEEPAVRTHEDGATVALRVVPRAPRTEIVGRHGDRIRLKVAAPPVEGAANEAVAVFLAERCGVRAADVQVLVGERSRDKVVLVRGVPAEVLARALRTSEAGDRASFGEGHPGETTP